MLYRTSSEFRDLTSSGHLYSVVSVVGFKEVSTLDGLVKMLHLIGI